MQLLEPRRLFSAGDLDPTFSGDGYALIPAMTVGGEDTDDLRAVAQQPDGKLIVLAAGASTLHLRRLTADGLLDTSFGVDGDVGTGLSGIAYSSYLAIDPSSGRIALRGLQPNTNIVSLFTVFTADGQPDPSFGTSGTVAVDLGINPRAIAFQSDGKLIVAGVTHTPNDGIILKRLDTSGQVDPTFGVDGQMVMNADLKVGRADFYGLRDLVIDSGDRIIVGADYQRAQAEEDLFDALVFRFDASGQPDLNFDGDGRRTITGLGTTPVQVLGVSVSADGSIQAMTKAYVAAKGASTYRITQMGGDGVVGLGVGYTGPLLSPRGTFQPRDFGLDEQGRIVVIGQATRDDGDAPFAARYDVDGTLDLSYGQQGAFQANAATLVDRPLLIDPAGRVIFGGSWVDPLDASQLILLRLDTGEGPAVDFRLNALGTLSVYGRNTSEDASVFIRPSDERLVVRVGDVVRSFPPEAVNQVALYLYGGDDVLSIANGVTGAYVEAGDGDDTIAGSPGDDTMYGGFGNDRIYGNDGGDTIFGGQNEDFLLGCDGADELYGERGVDTLSGGEGDDRLFGGLQHADENYGGVGMDSAANDEKDFYIGCEQLLDVLL